MLNNNVTRAMILDSMFFNKPITLWAFNGSGDPKQITGIITSIARESGFSRNDHLHCLNVNLTGPDYYNYRAFVETID